MDDTRRGGSRSLATEYANTRPRRLESDPLSSFRAITVTKRTKKPAESSASLKAAVDSLEATAAKTNTLAELRAWRIAMAKKLIRPKGQK